MNKSSTAKASPFFKTIDISVLFNRDKDLLGREECSEELVNCKESIPCGADVRQGIPFEFGKKGGNNIFLLKDKAESFIPNEPLIDYTYLVFAHSADMKKNIPHSDGIFNPMMGNPRLGEVVCEYGLEYEDRTSHEVKIKRRFNINEIMLDWGAGAFEAVPAEKPGSNLTVSEYFERGLTPEIPWGESQTRVKPGDVYGRYALWLYALENPYPQKKITSIHFTPINGTVLISGITGCSLNSNPFNWQSRKKAVVTLPEGVKVNRHGDYENIHLDLGQIISVQPKLDYDNGTWESGYNNKQPISSDNTVIIEYTAHPSAFIYLDESKESAIPVSELQQANGNVNGFAYARVPEASRRVTFRVKDKTTGRAVPVKIHIHGASGEYLPPLNRHRIPNRFWYEDYSADFVHGSHLCTYIDGEAEYRLPLGDIFIEVSKGFEIKPVRQKYYITETTEEITVELERVLSWREKGWVTADTHVHFLSPQTALLEGEAEGVNIVNLLASQWGELFTNIGDFDGKTTLGSRENGGTGEFLVRIGTENRQHILGHISLLGYEGRMILPLTTGGPDESALGDPVEETLCGWAQKCREQNGVVVLPHFPNPRAEGSAAIVSGLVDGVEMTSWGDLYSGISPYSLSDWYRYLNCGYNVPAVGGTDKMSADTAVGTVRTYAKIKDKPFTYENWKEAIKSRCTFVTYGPLMEFTVEGTQMGGGLVMPGTGGTMQVEWKVSSITVPVTKIELVVNGETREVYSANPGQCEYSGSWPVKVEHNCWIALRVRGRQPGKVEMIAAHSSAVMVNISGESCFNAADAMTILEQIEGAVAYVSTISTKADEKVYKKLMMTLTSAHRTLHNRMHQNGVYHNHNIVEDHH